MIDPGPLSFWNAVARALSLEDAVFRGVQLAPEGLGIALGVIVLAGLSEALGQSVVLFANRVKPRRFVLSLVLSSLLYTLGFVFLTFSIWLVGSYVFGRREAFDTTVRAVGLGYAPRLFGFFALMPYFGTLIGLLLSLWSLIAILVAIHIALNLTFWQAFLCSLLGWLLLQVVQRTIGRPVIWLGRWLRTKTAGVPMIFDRRQLAELLRGSPPGMERKEDHER